MSEVRQLINRLEKFRDKISDPRNFYREMREPWTELARRVVEQTLVNVQPHDVDSQLWQIKIVQISARVSVMDFLEADEMGLMLSIAPRYESGLPDDPLSFTLGNLSIHDVEQWVEAGREKSSPDDAGKNLDERDAGKTDLQIAWRIMYALKLQKPGWDRLLSVLREFVGLEAEEAADVLYPELLKAWFEHFAVRAPQDWRNYVHRLVESI